MSGLSGDERLELRSAARAALGDRDWLAVARAALDGEARPDDWPVAMTAGWPGLLADEAAGGAGLGAPEALLVVRELGRSLAGIPLFGHLMATAAAGSTITLPDGVATGRVRAAWLPVRPEGASGAGDATSVDPIEGPRRPLGPEVDERGRVTGVFGWVPDAPGADVLVCAATDPKGRARTVVVASATAEVEQIVGYDASRRLGHVRLHGALATDVVATPAAATAEAWALAQALLGADSLGAAERLLELSVEHAKTRFAFGRAIGSFQAVKHQLVELLRRIENGRALLHRAGTALAAGEANADIVAGALRFTAGDALDHASRTAIAVHGGMGATWEHPAGLYFRRAQVSRRLMAGHGAAAAEVGRRLLTARA